MNLESDEPGTRKKRRSGLPVSSRPQNMKTEVLLKMDLCFQILPTGSFSCRFFNRQWIIRITT